LNHATAPANWKRFFFVRRLIENSSRFKLPAVQQLRQTSLTVGSKLRILNHLAAVIAGSYGKQQHSSLAASRLVAQSKQPT
jgi:hypothetical protein